MTLAYSLYVHKKKRDFLMHLHRLCCLTASTTWSQRDAQLLYSRSFSDLLFTREDFFCFPHLDLKYIVFYFNQAIIILFSSAIFIQGRTRKVR